jgi:DNA repair ATPase RecN
MKFHITQIHLWLKDNRPNRVLNFLPNKVNVITGNSGTGKSSIITIIDYCLLGSESKLVEEHINEHILWYGLKFSINNKEYFIARKRMEQGILSNDIYFSSNGEIPSSPTPTISINDLKKILELEFSIDSSITIPYGGHKIKAGQKVSFRYFLLFNTQSSPTILNPNLFFDFDLYDSAKYREALDRIFDLAIGVDTVDNVLVKDKLDQIEKEIIKYEKKQKLTEKELNIFSTRILELMTAAQEYELIEKKLFTAEEGLERLRALVNDYKEDKINTDLSELEELNTSRRNLVRQIRNLRSFELEYGKYRDTLDKDADSLQPIEYIYSNYYETIPIPEIKSFIEGLNEELVKIKSAIGNKKPFSVNIGDEIDKKEKELTVITNQIKNFPIQTKHFVSSISKFIFIGELKAKLSFYLMDSESENYPALISELKEEYSLLSGKLQDTEVRKSILMQILLDRIQQYISSSEAIDDYNKFKAYWNYKDKILQLREPSAKVPSNIGSSSNHMFLHLFLFLGLHEHFIKEKVPFIPQFLIFDQLSQPYYGEAKIQGKEEIDDDNDKNKLTKALQLLNEFITKVTVNTKEEFQIILLEHAPKEYWAGMENYHLVEEFRNGNSLVN